MLYIYAGTQTIHQRGNKIVENNFNHITVQRSESQRYYFLPTQEV